MHIYAQRTRCEFHVQVSRHSGFCCAFQSEASYYHQCVVRSHRSPDNN